MSNDAKSNMKKLLDMINALQNELVVNNDPPPNQDKGFTFDQVKHIEFQIDRLRMEAAQRARELAWLIGQLHKTKEGTQTND